MAKSVERHLHTLMCSVSVVTVVFIHTMEDDQRLNTLVYVKVTLYTFVCLACEEVKIVYQCVTAIVSLMCVCADV